jgi:hypothetical protein
VSRHLAEEAISYFEECVSISTLDSTDFSLEEPHQNSGGTVPRKSNSRFLLKGESSSLESYFPTDRHNYNEVSESIYHTWSFDFSSLTIKFLFLQRPVVVHFIKTVKYSLVIVIEFIPVLHGLQMATC